MIAHVTAAPRPTSAAPAGGPEPSGATGSVLPEPEPLVQGGLDAALAALYAVMSQQRQTSLVQGKARVQDAADRSKRALADQEAARARQEANEASHGSGFFSSIAHTIDDVVGDVVRGRLDHVVGDGDKDVSDALNSPAFWSDFEKGALWVAKVAAVVGSVALTVASGGAGAATLALAAMLLSVGGEVVSDTKCLGKDSQAVGMGMEVGGAALGAGGALASSGASAADSSLKAVGVAADATSAGATAAAGGAHIVNARFAAAAQDAAADVVAAGHHAQEMQNLVSWVIDDMKADDKARQRGLQEVEGAIHTSDQTAAAAVMPPITVKG